MKKVNPVPALFILFVLLCLNGNTQTTGSYQQEINNWHKQRIRDLKAENGWLNLTGLLWLEQGRNNFGSAADNQLVFPKGTIPKHAGYFYRDNDTVSMTIFTGVPVTIMGKPVNNSLLFQNDTTVPVISAHGNLRWTIIKRGNRLAVRLRNLDHAQLKQFKGIKRFPVDTAWKITATLQTKHLAGTIPITNVLGQTSNLKLAGRLHFTINNQSYSLDALEEGDELFIIFADATNAKKTYPSGRFLYVNKPGADGQIFIDFNKAINPPCAFTPFATCPLPPRQNRLPVPVTAGEQRYAHQ